MKLACAAVLLCATTAHAQWTIQDSHTIADLRGIHALGKGVAWASGTEGTVLRTTNDGKDWQRCATPPDADHLDFRGIQAFDADTAIIMSIGKGPLSRLYKTTDGCKSWALIFTNPDPEGFWDAVAWDFRTDTIYILGDPVHGFFRLFSQTGRGEFSTKLPEKNPSLMHGKQISSAPAESTFAASNSSLLLLDAGDGSIAFITGGSRSEFVQYVPGILAEHMLYSDWSRAVLPFDRGPSSGAFSVAVSPWDPGPDGRGHMPIVIVGGDYTRPNATTATAVVSNDIGLHFQPSATPPHGFRSAVAYDPATKTWITVGPNGTDISSDDGRNWRPLHPAPTDSPDADQHWNALSLPFVVGPYGRIGKLEPQALSTGH